MIALIDYGSGNIQSVLNALRHEGAEVELVSESSRLAHMSGVVLPGVGAFGDCVRGLQSRGLWDPLREWLSADLPFLGICVGYQLLFEQSQESPGIRGFGHFGGGVKKFEAKGLKIPQIGWNQLDLADPQLPLWKGLPAAPHMYFVHSYYPAPTEPGVVTSHCTYGETFAASVGRGNVSAVQFHPEKSQTAGLTILRNFIRSVPAVLGSSSSDPSA
jgi:imidazole glycerol-phosphate synthase subunit HisH